MADQVTDQSVVDRQRALISDLRTAGKTWHVGTEDAQKRNASDLAKLDRDRDSRRAEVEATFHEIAAHDVKARSLLGRKGADVGWLVVKTPDVVADADRRTPIEELRRVERVGGQTVRELQSRVEALERHRESVAARKRLLRVTVASVVVVAALTYFWGLQPCGWAHLLLGQPSGCYVRLSGQLAWPRALAFAPGFSDVVQSGGEDGSLNGWRLPSRLALAFSRPATMSEPSRVERNAPGTLFTRAPLTALTYSGTDLFGAGAGGQIWLVNTAMVAEREGAFWSLAGSPDRRSLASASEDGTVRIFSRQNRTINEERILGRHAGPVYAVAFSADGSLVVSGGGDNSVRLWNVSTAQPWHTWTQPAPVTGVAFAGRTRTVVTAGHNGAVGVWDIDADTRRQLWGHEGPVWQVAASPDSTLAASAGEDGSVRLWDLVGGRELRWLGSHGGPATTIAFSPDGRWVASGSKFPDAIMWEVASRER